MGTTIQLEVPDIQVNVVKSTLIKTDHGMEGSFVAVLPDGRVMEAEGVWDDPYRDDGEIPTMQETVKIDGEVLASDGENSAAVEIETPGGLDGVSAEDIADAYLRHNPGKTASLLEIAARIASVSSSSDKVPVAMGTRAFDPEYEIYAWLSDVLGRSKGDVQALFDGTEYGIRLDGDTLELYEIHNPMFVAGKMKLVSVPVT